MPALILYLLKVNIALVLFYLAYHFVLRRLTFYTLNRCFLVFGILFSTCYPFIDLSELFIRHRELAAMHTYATTMPYWAATRAIPEQALAIDYWQIPLFLFWGGAAAMAIRLLLQFVSLYKLHNSSVPAAHKGISFREVTGISGAFSFWQTIYLNSRRHKKEELKAILQHEQVHVQGWHTADVLLAELSIVIYWFNPGTWLMKKAIKENLEFIADQHVVAAGVDSKEYQYLLLKVVGATQPQITNQFNFPSLKRRIAMINKKQSSLMQIVRYAAVVPLITAPTLMLTANSNAQETTPVVAAQTAQKQTDPTGKLQEAAIYFIDGVETTRDAANKLDPRDIHSMNVLKGEEAQKAFGKRAANGVISIVTEKNKNSKQVQEFHERFPQPPAPPVPQDAPLPPPPPPVRIEK